MPSKNPMIGVRVDPQLYKRIEAAARQEGRSLSNFVAHHLAEMLPPVGKVHQLPVGRARSRRA